MADDTTQRWQAQAATPAKDRGERRRRWFIALTGLLLALVATAAVLFLLLRPLPSSPFLLTIEIGEFNARQYPVLAFARLDGERLGRHFPDRRRAETKTRELVVNELRALAGRTEPLLVHLSALALVRDESIYLVPGDADPDDESTLLDVREIIDAVGRCSARHKLLILDLAHPVADARLGVLVDRTSQALEEYLAAAPPSYFVLCPTSAGQFSLGSETLQCSALANYIDQGLQGAADADNDLRVTVQELFAFVQLRVERWAQLNRGARQRPRLFGKADDFVLAGIGKNTPAAVERTKPAAYPARLQDGWQQRDRWQDQGALRLAPRLLMRLEANLLRQEALWRGGALGKNDWESFDTEIAAIERDLGRATQTQPLPPRSLMVARAGAKDNPALAEMVLNTALAAKDTGDKKDARALLVAELVKKLQEPKDANFAQQASAVVEALDRAAELRPEHLQLAQDVLARLSPDRRYVELLCVRRLADFAERVQVREPESWPAEKAHAMLEAVRRREQVIATLSQAPELLAWVAPAIEQADLQRQKGEQKLLWEKPSSWSDAFVALTAAAANYKQAGETLDNMRRGRHDLDRSLAELPAYLAQLCDWPEFDAQAEASWRSAAREALVLTNVFGAPPNKDLPPAALDAHSRNLHRHLDDLAKLLARQSADAKKGESGVNLAQAICLLQSPLLRTTERLALFAKQGALEASLQTETDTLDQEDARAGQSPARPMAPGAYHDVGIARARMSLGLLRLGGVSGKELLVESVGKLNAQEWSKLERGVQALWTQHLIKQWQAPNTATAADRLDRLVPPWEVDRRGSDAKEPSRLLYKQQRQALVRWLVERYDADANALAAITRDALAVSFFREAAQELRLTNLD
jgi:hypothetical protein